MPKRSTSTKRSQRKSDFFVGSTCAYFAEKLLDSGIPIYRNDKSGSSGHQRPLEDYQDPGYVLVSTKIPGSVPYTTQHEGVHVDQHFFEKLPAHFSYNPYDYVAYVRFLEHEAYSWEDYMILQDYKSGILTKEQIFDYQLIGTSFYQTLCVMTQSKGIQTKDQLLGCFDKLSKQNHFPTEKEFLAINMAHLSMSPNFMQSITVQPIEDLAVINKYVKDSKSISDPILKEKTFKRAGLNMTSSFQTEFDLEAAHRMLHRNGIPYFDTITTAAQEMIMNNIFTFTPEEVQAIQQLTPDIQSFCL